MEKTATRVATEQEVQLLTFWVDDQEYALNIHHVVQVVRMVAITRSPRAPKIVEGMINMRGKVIPVISLRKRFSLAEKRPCKRPTTDRSGSLAMRKWVPGRALR